MRWIITGGSGQLGTDLITLLNTYSDDVEVVAPTRSELDVRDFGAVTEFIRSHKPDAFVNCAAWTNVDLAESHEEEARILNADLPSHIANEIESNGRGVLVHVSTDYVFGETRPALHTEDDPVTPRCAYARTKAQGESGVRAHLPDRHLIVRTAWLYGANGSNFAKTILRKLQTHQALQVVNDQYGQPTWSRDAAQRIVDLTIGHLSSRVNAGTYHAVNSGSASWWAFAREIASLAGFENAPVKAISSSEISQAATRPSDSRLSDGAALKAGLPAMREWRSALAVALPEIKMHL